MKLVKNIKLYFQESNSDKVYEVDLCEQDNSLYLVNFRYGRRGTALKEGTKTVFPVSITEAEKVFHELVNSKKKKGYTESEIPGYQSESNAPLTKENPAARNKTIVNHLNKAKNDNYDGDWEISRIIWRAGELKIQEAVNPIIALCSSDDESILYAACYALGRIKNPAAISVLGKILERAIEEHLKRFAILALMNVLAGQDKVKLADKLIGNLPIGLRQIISDRNVSAYEKQINDYISDEQNINKEFVWYLYILSLEYEFIRPSLVEAISKIPLKSNYFKPIRHLYKSAELLDDYEVLGILAYKFAKTEAKYNANDYYVEVDGKWCNVREELAKGNHIIAFTKKTRDYFNRRLLRNLIKAGIENSLDYTKFATPVLLAFSDEIDKKGPIAKHEYQYNSETRRYESVDYHYDSYSNFIMFYYILYNKSNRYTYKKGAKNWDCINQFVPGGAIPVEREEAFPELWDKSPNDIILLLEKSKAERVHQFANKVFNANPDFEKEITTSNIINFLSCPFDSTIKLGLEIAKKIYDPKQPSFELVLALINSQLAEARLLAMNWVFENQQLFFKDIDFISSLICSKNDDVRTWISNNLKSRIDKEQQHKILLKVFEKVNLLEGEGLDILLESIGNIVIQNMAEALGNMSETQIESLFSAPKVHLMIFAGKLLLVSKDIELKSAPYLSLFLQSDNRIVRQTGLEILGRFSESSLLTKSAMLASFCISELEDIRKAVRPIIQKLSNYNKEFAIGLINSFIPVFTEKEPYEGVHEDLFHLFENELITHCSSLPENSILKLLKSNYQYAQLIGTLLFKKYVDINKLDIGKIIQLANSDVIEIRELCQNYFTGNVSKIKYDKSEAIKLLDAKWLETREFAFTFFENNFSEQEWNLDLLIRICDSVKPDVQLFGRKLLLQFFKSENAEEYLLKLSQHPEQNLQLFTSQYIEQYAAGNIEIVNKLRYYFKVVLRQINKGSVTKKRAFQFLENESLKNIEIAKIALEILNEVSLTIAKGDKSRCLEIMLAIKDKYPEMPSILSEKEFITK